MSDVFTERYAITLGKDLVADGTSEVTSAVEDMSGYDEITFIAKLGDVDAAAVLTFTVKENTAASTSSPTPTVVSLASATSSGAVSAVLTSGAVVVTESNGNLDDKLVVITVKGSSLSKRYVFLSITVADESFELDSLITIKGRARNLPVTQGTDAATVVSMAS